MDRRTLRASLLAAICCAVAMPATADAQVSTTLTDWNLTDSVSAWGGGTQFHISTGGSTVSYTWLDSPNKTTVISGNGCSDLSVLGSDTIGVNDTSAHSLFSGGSGLCFLLRGRTATGSGSMVNHDGRLTR